MKIKIIGSVFFLSSVYFLWVLFFGERINQWEIKNFPASNSNIICFGDSLVAGVGANSKEETYPAYLQNLLGVELKAIGFPGMTAEDGAKKIETLDFSDADIIIVTLGGNDILKRVNWKNTEKHLKAIFSDLHNDGYLVVFSGVNSPFGRGRNKKYTKVCRESGVYFIPNVLGGIITDVSLKADNIHPNSRGYKKMAEKIAENLDM
ncbi:MAG: GDSL-type esterase/lipase family protein [Verrucomicrobiota bacterium]|nr:GDSL-type esterase/lipase family protein [Verrucomicrobiota bacterium]